MSTGPQDIGIAGGDFALMGDGKLKLDSLPASCQLLEGDLVVTSGLGGYLPPDLVIGSVSELRADDSDTSSLRRPHPRCGPERPHGGLHHQIL